MGTEKTTEKNTEKTIEKTIEKTTGKTYEKKESIGKTTEKKGSIGNLFTVVRKSTRSRTESGYNSEDDIKKLTRTELLELLIDETKEADRLRADNERLKEELKKCHEDLDRIASFEAVIARLESIVNGR